MSTSTSAAATVRQSGSPTLPILMVLGSCTSLQFGAALATLLFEDLGSWGTTALRLGIAGVLLMLLSRPALRGLDRSQWRAVVLLGVVMGAMNGTFYAAIDRIPLGTAVAIEFLGPLAVAALLSTRRGDLLWVLLALGGVSLFGIESLSGSADLDLVGVGFALVAAIFWGLYVLASAKVGSLVPGQGGLALALLVGAVVILPIGAPGAVRGLVDPWLLLVAAGTAVLASLLPYTLELSALRRVPRHVFGILLSLEPAIALLAGIILLGQGASTLRIAAAALVVIASIGVTLTARRPAAGAQEPGADESAEEPAASWEAIGEQDLPVPTHATITGEMPALSVEDDGEDGHPGRPGSGVSAPIASNG